MVRLKKPMAAGTRTHSDVAIVIDLGTIDLETVDLETLDLEAIEPDAPIASTVLRTAGSRSATPIGVQLSRSRRRLQIPVAKRITAAHAPSAQARKTKNAQRPGMMMAGRKFSHDVAGDIDEIPAIVARPSPKLPSSGSAATVSNAVNQTANRVPEFCRGETRSNNQAKTAISNPAGSALRMRSTGICAIVCQASQFISSRSESCPSAPYPDESCPDEPASPAGARFPPARHPGPQAGSARVAPVNS